VWTHGTIYFFKRAKKGVGVAWRIAARHQEGGQKAGELLKGISAFAAGGYHRKLLFVKSKN
jgi:hypothetical protein